MRHHLLLVLVLLLLTASGCSLGGPEASRRSHGFETDGLGASAAPSSAPFGGGWLAFDDQDRVVAFDPASGAVVATGPALPGVERDLAFDPHTGRVAVFVSEEGDGGAIHELSPSLQSLGTEPTPIDGRVELWFGPQGLWLFEESYGVRWRRIRRDGAWEPSWPLPPPSSLWSEAAPHFGALVAEGAGAVWLEIDPTSPTVPLAAQALPAVAPVSGAARAARLGEGLAVAWPTPSGLRICQLDGSGGLMTERFLSLTGPVRQAAPLTMGDEEGVALLIDEPPRVVAVELGSGQGMAVEGLGAGIDEDLRIDRRMVSSGGRLWVATSEGIEALDFDPGSGLLKAAPDFAGEHLRGPLQALADRSPFQGSGKSGL